METMKKMTNYIAMTREGDKEKAKTELVLGVQWFQKQIYEANILQNVEYKYADIKISPP